MGGSKVLSSFNEYRDDVIVHHIYETRTVYGDRGIRDEIGLYHTIYTIKKDSGKIFFTTDLIRKIIN